MSQKQTEVFGRRREPHTIIIARGNEVQHFTLRPWLGAVAGTVVIAFAVGYLMATSYLVLRDDLIGASIARQARMQHAYEDRIAALRSQMDRIISRQLLDQQEMANKVAALMDRQNALADRHSKIAPLLDRIETGSTTIPVPSSNPRTDAQDHASAIGLFRTGRSPSMATGHAEADAADQTFAAISSSLAEIETAQIVSLNQVADEALATSAEVRTALKRVGISVPETTEESGTGGPLIDVADAPAYADDPFLASVRRLDIALSDLESVEKTAKLAPIGNPLPGQSISSRFGVRKDPILGKRAFHSGTDFRAPTGKPILAAGPGTVIRAEWAGGYGRMVEIRHQTGQVTRYAHMSKLLVSKGDHVEAGQRIGLVGSSGRSTGPHLHYEVRSSGEAVDPQRFMAAGTLIDDLL